MNEYTIENDRYRVAVDDGGRIVSLFVKELGFECIRETRLSRGFRINLPLKDRLNHYLDSDGQDLRIEATNGTTLRIACASMRSEQGLFPIAAEFTIELADDIRFRYRIDNGTEAPLAEIWFPMLGGLHGLGNRLDTEIVAPGYFGEIHSRIFRQFNEPMRQMMGDLLGNEDAHQAFSYPGVMGGMNAGIVMPWLSMFNRKEDAGLYLAEHNPIQRKVSFVFQLTPNYHTMDVRSNDDSWPDPTEVDEHTPIGMTFSKVAYPHTVNGRFDSGTFVLKLHRGDWHRSAKLYREWFVSNFPLREHPSWLRKEHAWFSTILYQPEDRMVADYEQYAKWLEDAAEIGIHTGELIGWDKGGLERNYPEYEPDAVFGGWEGYRKLVGAVHEQGGKLLTFVNYQVLDSTTEWYRNELHKYRRMDSFGQTENWMAWGESTLKAALGLDVRRHVPASVAVPGFTALLDEYLTRLVKEGTDGLQIDKLVVNGQLDFNPGHDRAPDLPMCEDLVQAIAALYEKCRAINPRFCMAAETNSDRYIPYAEVFYRAATPTSISTLRYTFPEWTSCIHVSSPFDYLAVNGAVMLGAVMVVEPYAYTRPVSDGSFRKLGRYIREALRIRRLYEDRIFLADYLDREGAKVECEGIGLDYRVHARTADGKRAVVIANQTRSPIVYRYAFETTAGRSSSWRVIEPFEPERPASASGEFTIRGGRFQLFIEEQ